MYSRCSCSTIPVVNTATKYLQSCSASVTHSIRANELYVRYTIYKNVIVFGKAIGTIIVLYHQFDCVVAELCVCDSRIKRGGGIRYSSGEIPSPTGWIPTRLINKKNYIGSIAY